MLELVLVKIGSSEWEYIWEYLKTHPINKGLDNPMDAPNEATGNMWEYMGTYMHNGKGIHQLRHLKHPLTNELKEISLNASSTFTQDQIEKKFKL